MAVHLNYKFTVVAYTKTSANTLEISKDLALNTSWGDGYKGFKADIRADLKSKQRNRCAFCRCRVSVGTSFSNLEHIVGKSAYPQFQFLPENLVYCCTRCNLSKSVQNTLSSPSANKSLQTFPVLSSGFNIINPYYDNYEDHVDFLDGIIIVIANGSAKGANTIKAYTLTRADLAEERANELKIDAQTINKKLLNRLLDKSLSEETLDQITSVIKGMPNWVLEK